MSYDNIPDDLPNTLVLDNGQIIAMTIEEWKALVSKYDRVEKDPVTNGCTLHGLKGRTPLERLVPREPSMVQERMRVSESKPTNPLMNNRNLEIMREIHYHGYAEGFGEMFSHPYLAPIHREAAAEKGLFDKYYIRRTDEQDAPGCRHDNCELFVMDITHDIHAQDAMLFYARQVAAIKPQLALDIMEKVMKARGQWGRGRTAWKGSINPTRRRGRAGFPMLDEFAMGPPPSSRPIKRLEDLMDGRESKVDGPHEPE